MATVEYDTIMLNIGSKMSDAGFTKAVKNLEKLKDVFPIPGLQESANAMQAFADAINSMSTDTIRALSGMRSAVRTSVKQLRNGVGITQTTAGLPTQGTMVAPDVNATMRSVAEEMGRVASASEEASTNTRNMSRNLGRAGANSKGLLGGLLNVARYRLLRAIITGVVQGFKQGAENLKEWDRTIGHTGFYESMTRGKEALEVLKNSLAVVSAPFLEFLVNLLVQATKLVMSLANGISRIIAILAGKSTYRAVKWADYAEETATGFGHASQEAEEFKRQLMGFDEINNLTAPGKGGGGGGSGGGGGFSFGEMFTEEDVGELSKIEQWLSKAGEAWRQGCENLKERFLNAWKTIKQKIQNLKEKWVKFVEEIKKLKEMDWKEWWEQFAGKKNRTVMEKFLSWMLIAYSSVFKAIALASKGDFEGAWKTIQDGSAEIKKILFEDTDEIVGKSKGAFDDVHETAKRRLKGVEDTATKTTSAVARQAELLHDAMKYAFDNKYKLDLDYSSLSRAVDNAYKMKNDLTTITAPKWHVTIDGTLEINEVDISGLGSTYFTITKFANGGFPNQGQLFIANEAGAEMVGTIGGSTAVATNQDIVSAVSQGVASAVASVLGGGTNVNVVLEGDARNLFRVVQSQARNYAIQTGSYAFG